ncbi:unknown [Psittacid alphaherpesvirus 1]|uniref:Uncharacterized protein sORF3/4 n=1 Tax=Psittacid herpesvirus 1 (isolate Amazon parrot/-/97-0001/1997) TaxID=670426 RepID=ORF3_PSHV1|nr:protein SORF3 [Psittacid alphaherpesvirus 1]Q6UDF3.1 RecName: Full=Uncharacterized protein sORF3/4 [Psittacid herpesvirus 1 Amazon parrot/1997]AAQ73757.1 unknown [Psittacid alphaherpesvirus 1]
MPSCLDYAFAAAFHGTDLPGGRFWRPRACAPVFVWSEVACAVALSARIFFEARERLAAMPIGEGRPPYGRGTELYHAARRTVSSAARLWDALVALAASAAEEICVMAWGKLEPMPYLWDTRDATKIPVLGPKLMALFSAVADGATAIATEARNSLVGEAGHHHNTLPRQPPSMDMPVQARLSLMLGMEIVRCILALALPSASFNIPDDATESIEESVRIFGARLSLALAKDPIPDPVGKFEEEETYYLRCLRSIYEIENILSLAPRRQRLRDVPQTPNSPMCLPTVAPMC